MALSGSVNTNAYSGRYYRVSWTAKQSTENNNSVISWKLEALGETGAWYAERTLKVVIAGTTVFSKTDRVERYDGTIKTGTITLNHDSEGNKSFAISVQAAVYGSSVNCSGSANFTLDTITRGATILTAPNFNDEENPTITYSNPTGNKVDSLLACISLTGSTDDVEYRDIPKTGTSYTFELTDAEREVLLKATTGGNSRTVAFYIRTIINGVTYHSYLTKTFSVVNANPIINPTVVDINDSTKNLTGDDSKFIKYYSNLSYSINPQLLKHATYKSYQVTCGSETKNTLSGTFNNVESNSITFSLTDSRNNTVTKTIDLDMINYIKPTCNLRTSFELETETTVKVKLNVTGKCFYGSFGAIANDPTVMYRYKIDNGEYGDWTYYSGDSVTYKNDEYSTEIEVTGLNYLNTYTVQTQIVDWLGAAISNEEVINVIPTFDWGKDDFNFNVPVTIQGNLVNDFIIGYGTEAMGSNGTWKIEYWASGKAVCYGVRNYGNMAVNTAWGNMYESARFSQNFPAGLFVEAPNHFNIGVYKSNVYLQCGYGYKSDDKGEVSKDSTGSFFFYRPTAATAQQVYVQFYAIGRWR